MSEEQQTPTPSPGPTKLECVVTAWRKRQIGQGASSFDVGRHAHAVIRDRLRKVYDPGSRRTLRSEALDSMVDAIARVGFKATRGELGRCIQLHHVALLFDPKAAKQLSLVALRPFCSAIKRNPAKEQWSIRPKTEEVYRSVWARVVSGSIKPVDVAAAVGRALGRKPKQPRPKPTPIKKAATTIARLSSDELTATLEYLKTTNPDGWKALLLGVKKLAVGTPPSQQTVPMPEVAETQSPPDVDQPGAGLFRRRRAG